MDQFPEDFKTPIGMFYHWELRKPDVIWLRQCLEEGDVVYTWAQAGKLARKLAAGMLALGLKKGDHIGIYSQNSAKWVITDLAIMMAGMVSVPIYASMRKEKLDYIVEHSEMKALFVGDKTAHSAAELTEHFRGTPQIIGISLGSNAVSGDQRWEDVVCLAPAIEGDPDWDFQRLWTLSYTSGTTGQPKGVMHSYSSSGYSAYCLNKLARLGEESRYFSYLPLGHISERVIVELHCLYSGGSVGFNESLDTFKADLRRIRPTYFNAVPRIWNNLKADIIAEIGKDEWRHILEDPEHGRKLGKPLLESMGLDAVVWAQTGAAPMPPSDINAWHCIGMPLVEGYGQTETMNGFFNAPWDNKIGSVGKVSQPGKVKISEQGEILLSSLGNMLGYYKDEATTAKTLVDGWIHTGDKGNIDEDGFVTITGRLKDIFKTAKGKYVAPAPIEGKFAFNPSIAQCCLVGSGLPQPVMLTVLQPNSPASATELQEHLDSINAGLENHEKISKVIICKDMWTPDNGMMTLTLKMLRPTIEDRYADIIRSSEDQQELTIIFEK